MFDADERSDAQAFIDELGGESITYYSAAAGELALTALVERHGIQRQKEDSGRSASSPIELSIARTALAAVDVTRDRVRVAREHGSATEWMPVVRVLEPGDPGFWVLAVGR